MCIPAFRSFLLVIVVLFANLPAALADSVIRAQRMLDVVSGEMIEPPVVAVGV